jgi:hypothetical protein
MGFAKFAGGSSGGAELVVWLRLRDELTKAIKRPEAAIKNLTNLQTQAAMNMSSGIQKFSKAKYMSEKEESLETIKNAKQRLSQSTDYLDILSKQQQAIQLGKQEQLGFGGVMKLGMDDWRKGREAGLKYNSMGGKMADGIRNMTHGMRGFRMELLSVMFFTQQLAQGMWGLLQPAMDTVGIFDILTAMWEILFLPVAMALLDILMPIFDWFTSLPEGVQMAIGVLVLIAAVVFTVIGALAALGLGLGGLIIALPLLIALFGVVAAVIGIIAVPILIIIALLIIFYIAWKNNTEGINKALQGLWDVFDSIFGGIIKIVQGVIEFFQAIFSGDTNKAFEALKKIAKGAIDLIIGWFYGLPIAIINVLVQIGIGLLNWAVKMPGFFLDLGSKIVKFLAEGIGSAGSYIANALWNVIPEPFRGWMKGAVGFASGLVGGAVQGIGDWWNSINGMAEGGIVTRPTLTMVGERGPEAVIPLSSMGTTQGHTIYFNPYVTINVSEVSPVDMDEITKNLSDRWISDLRGRIGAI